MFQFITFFFVLSSKIQDSLPYVNIETTNAVYARIFTDKSITSSFQIRNSRPKAAWAFFILLLRFGSLSPSYLIRCPRYTNSGTILSFSSPIVSTFFESFSIICSRFRFLIYSNSSVRDFVLFRFGFEHAPFLVRCNCCLTYRRL